jgi:hypothetical protein
MRKEDTSAQGKIVTEILQHLHACKKSVEVFYGRVEELEQLKDYITGSLCVFLKRGHLIMAKGGGGQ